VGIGEIAAGLHVCLFFWKAEMCACGGRREGGGNSLDSIVSTDKGIVQVSQRGCETRQERRTSAENKAEGEERGRGARERSWGGWQEGERVKQHGREAGESQKIPIPAETN
jgi:hypothetical protein